MNQCALLNQNFGVNFVGFKIKLMENKKYSNDNDYKKEKENYCARMDFLDAIKNYIQRDKDKHQILYSLNDAVCIVNSCDGVAHPVTKCCGRTMLTHATILLTPLAIKFHSRNLENTFNFLSVMSVNGKEDAKNA